MTKSSLKRHDMAFSYEKYVATDNMSVSVMRKKDQKNFHQFNLLTSLMEIGKYDRMGS